MEELEPTTIEDYKKRTHATKVVALPSGARFEIKKVSGRDFLRQGNIPLQGTRELMESEEYRKAWWDKLSDEQKKKQMETLDEILSLAVASPQLSTQPGENALLVSELTDDDYYALLSEITTFSFGGGERLKPFRPQPDASLDRPARPEIPPASASNS